MELFFMKHYLLFQALGDNLISLSLLEKLHERVNVLGTKDTKIIIKLLGLEENFNVRVVFDEIPAFYNIREKGFINALRDSLILLKYINNNNIDKIVFEKNDFRSSILSLILTKKVIRTKNNYKNTYKNRKDNIEYIYNKNIQLDKYRLEVSKENTINKKILINPLTSKLHRNIRHKHLKYIIDELNRNGFHICLIDIENRYQEFKDDVNSYLTNTTLDDVKELILISDLYIGADSFLVHLSYYLKKTYFIVFYQNNDDFLPPNANDKFYLKCNELDNFEENLKNKFKKIGLI